VRSPVDMQQDDDVIVNVVRQNRFYQLLGQWLWWQFMWHTWLRLPNSRSWCSRKRNSSSLSTSFWKSETHNSDTS